mgnify:FL=1
MLDDLHLIDSPESMTLLIREVGIIPFTKNTIPGWSVEEQIAPGYWPWDSEAGDELGPWDWKIDVLHEGDIAYGKFIRNKAAFATVGWYRHLMNWRRSQPKYRVAIGEKYRGTTQMDQLYKAFSQILLEAIREYGAVEGSDIRKILSERTTREQRSKIKGSLQKYLIPDVKRTAADYLNQYLEMGTWTVVGDFRRVYRGPNLEYKGWQKSSITTPDELFGTLASQDDAQFSAKLIEDKGGCDIPDCSPEESRDLIIDQILRNFPDADRNELSRLI